MKKCYHCSKVFDDYYYEVIEVNILETKYEKFAYCPYCGFFNLNGHAFPRFVFPLGLGFAKRFLEKNNEVKK